jgi:hypothetical protein
MSATSTPGAGAPGAAPAASASTTTSTPAAASSTSSQPSQSGTTPPAGAASTDWTTGLNDEMKGYVQNKGFKDPSSVLDSYKNLEKLMGTPKERLLRLPENMEDQQAMGEIYAKLGRPNSPDDYKIEADKQNGNPEFAKFLKNTFFENGLTTKQALGIVNKWNEMQTSYTKQVQEQQSAQNEQQMNNLKKEWGAAYEQKVNVAKRAARDFGVAPEVIDHLEKAMGFSGVMKFFDTIGSKLGEADYVSAGQNNNSFAMTPEAARNKLQALKSDPDFVKRYAAGDHTARAEMERLHKMAYQ